jgi:Putative zinc-finger
MKVPDEMLMAYADGELDAAGRARVEAALATDPEVARRVAAHRALRSTLATGFGKVLEEPVPERLVSLARSAAAPPGKGQVLPFRRKATAPRPWLQWGSLAASFVLGALVWQFGARQYLSGPVVDRDGELLAAGVLARALNSQLAAGQTPATPVQIGISFLSRAGDYCRTFQLRGDAGVAGLACQRDARWQLEVLTHTAGTSAAPQYRQATSALPPAVLQAVSDAIAGEPLDAAAETRARANAWRAR